ncbi:MAG: PEGA domain-containing protein [Candidatus Saccharimonadales bacterium]
MDFLDPAKMRQHRIRLLIGYCLIAVAIIIVSYLLLLQSFGFDYDRKTGQIIQNGLVYVSAHPTSANVYLNNIYKGKTNLKLTIPSGNYNFALKSRGYRNWYATVNLDGGGVVRLNYPLLIPQNLVTNEVRTYAKTPGFISASPDRHWLVMQQPDSMTKFDIYDLTKKTPTPATINLPAAVIKTVSGLQAIKLVEWSADNQHLLIEHDFSGGKEFVVIDYQTAANSYNVNSLLSTAPDSVQLHNKRFDRLYVYIAKTKTLLDINAGNKQATNVIKDVLDFKAFGNSIVLYTSDVSKVAGKYSVNIWDGQKSYLLHNYPASTAYKLEMANYNGQTYVAVAPQASNKLYVFKNPLSIMKTGKVPNPFIALKINNPQFISFSGNAQFVIAQNGASFAAYDFDTDLWHYFTLKNKIPAAAKAAWMDGNRLTMNIDNNINVFDFNGSNQQILSPSLTGMDGFFDNNYSHLYTIGPSTKQAAKTALTSTLMVVR